MNFFFYRNEDFEGFLMFIFKENFLSEEGGSILEVNFFLEYLKFFEIIVIIENGYFV